MLEVLAPGPLCTVQDRGRRGWAHLGVGHSGAADQRSYALANRLVGNHVGAAALECTLGGLRLLTRSAVLLATAGAACDVAVDRGPAIGHQHPHAIPSGATLTWSVPRSGLRTYIAVRGGIDAEVVMGSRSTDTLSGLGPPPLQVGDRLRIGADPLTDVPTIGAPVANIDSGAIVIWPGPRTNWFSDDALATLVMGPYVVGSDSNRIGVRLAGVPLERVVVRELPSEAMVEGAIQVTTDGQPVVLLADHGTMGGYPVIAVVDPAHIGRIAQARPGHTLTFHWR